MNEKLEKVKMGYAHLSLDDRKLFQQFMQKIDKSTWTEDKAMINDLEIETKFDIFSQSGNPTGKCPCCGK